MRRLPVIAFAALVAATVAAFFITQHLKVSTPLATGFRGPSPAVFNPRSGTTCGDPPVDYRRTSISFYLLHRSDDVDVYITDQGGNIVRTLAAGVHMQGGANPVRKVFVWNGREDSGRIAPDGIYYIRVALIHQGRTVTVSNASGPVPVKVKTRSPAPVVTSATPHLIPNGSNMSVTIDYAGNESRGGTVHVYRTDLPGKPQLVKSFLTPWKGHQAKWDGTINGRRAPAGTYLVGLDVTDAACNTGHSPRELPPIPGSTNGAGVSVRYLAAQPPLVPVPAGSRALVYVDSRHRPYSWSLYRAGARKATASGRASAVALRVPVPRGRAGLYELRLRSGSHTTTAPIVVHASKPARALVVLPALTWQGLNPVDDDGDGMPNTLSSGRPVKLARPFVDGLPAGLGDEATLLGSLDSSHHSYDLNTDLGLLAGVGPSLKGHTLVVLAGTERWLPASQMSALRSYVAGGGHVLSFGIGSLLRSVRVAGGAAQDPSAPSSADALGAAPRPVVSHNADVIGVLTDGLGVFSSTSGVFTGLRSYQPFAQRPGTSFSTEAGVSPTAPAIVGYRLGRGTVVDVGLPGFASYLARDLDARELLGQAWTVLSR
ncbi:MAG TPA: FlgD immunoglobulin-like domain containing protein [Solirubrobacteraceae bacterium]